MIMIYQKLSHISLVNFHFKLETNQVVENLQLSCNSYVYNGT